MPVRYYIQEYRVTRTPVDGGREEIVRDLPIADFTEQIYAAGGAWSEIEFIGNRALVKVRAPDAVLTGLDAQGWFELPRRALSTPLSQLTVSQRNVIRAQVTAAGYTLQEFQTALPDFTVNTVADLLRFLCSRRHKPRWNAANARLDFDPIEQPTKSLAVLEREVAD